jgi:hypothetical protein
VAHRRGILVNQGAKALSGRVKWGGMILQHQPGESINGGQGVRKSCETE